MPGVVADQRRRSPPVAVLTTGSPRASASATAMP